MTRCLSRIQAELDSGQVIVIDTGTASRDDDSPGSSVSCALLDGRNPAAPPLPSSIDGDPASPTTAARLWAAVRGAWGPAEVPPLTPEEQEARAARDRSVTAASLVHGWDVRLRKAVSVHLERGAFPQPTPAFVLPLPHRRLTAVVTCPAAFCQAEPQAPTRLFSRSG